MDDIDLRAWKDTYARDWRLRAQQTKSRIAAVCDNEPESTDERYFYFDTMGTTGPEPKVGYAPNTPDVSVASERRRGSWQPWHWGKLYDKHQTKKLIADPKPKHQMNAIAGFNRTLDDIIIAACAADVIVLDTTDTGVATALPSAQIKTEAGTAGLTLAKLHTMREMFDDAEVDEIEMDPNGQIVGEPSRNIICSSRQITNLLDDAKVGSSDYNTVKALAAGAIHGFAGFRFIRSARLTKSGNMRKIITLAKGAMGITPVKSPEVSFDIRADKSRAGQLYLDNEYGAIRIEDVRVITTECYEA